MRKNITAKIFGGRFSSYERTLFLIVYITWKEATFWCGRFNGLCGPIAGWPWKGIRWRCIEVFATSKMEIWGGRWYTCRRCKWNWRSRWTATGHTMRTTIVMIALLMMTTFCMVRWRNDLFGRCGEILCCIARMLLCIVGFAVVALVVIVEKGHLAAACVAACVATCVATIRACVLLMVWTRIAPFGVAAFLMRSSAVWIGHCSWWFVWISMKTESLQWICPNKLISCEKCFVRKSK